MSNWYHHMGTSPLCMWFAACELNFSIWPCCSADTNFRKAVWQRWCISNVIKFKRWDSISANWAHLHKIEILKEEICIIAIHTCSAWRVNNNMTYLAGRKHKVYTGVALVLPASPGNWTHVLQERDAYYCYAYLFISPSCIPSMLKHVSPNPYLPCNCYVPDPALGKGPLVRSFSEETEVCD